MTQEMRKVKRWSDEEIVDACREYEECEEESREQRAALIEELSMKRVDEQEYVEQVKLLKRLQAHQKAGTPQTSHTAEELEMALKKAEAAKDAAMMEKAEIMRELDQACDSDLPEWLDQHDIPRQPKRLDD